MTATDQDTTVGLSVHERRVRGLSNWVRDFPIGQGGINEFEMQQLYGMLPHTDPAAASSLLDQLGDQLLIMGGHDQRDQVYREASERFHSLVEDAVSDDENAAQQQDRPVEIASLPIEELPDWTELAEAVGATLHNVEVGCSGEYQTEMRWPDGRVATYRDRLAIISGDSELPPTDWQVVFERLAAEVALLRQAAEAYWDAVVAYTTERNVGPLSTSLGWVIRHGEIGKALDNKASR